MPTITNTNVDTAAASVPGPYGPLTRKTNMSNLPTPNDRYKIELEDQNGNKIVCRYEELTDPDRILELVYEANGYQGLMHKTILELEAIESDFPKDSNGEYTYEDYMAFVQRLRSLEIIRNYL